MKIHCPHCDQKIEVQPSHSGQSAHCPACEGPFQVPLMQQPPPTPYQTPAAPPQQPQGKLGDDAGMRLLLPVGRSGWAIAAGYLGLFSFIIFPAPLALIVSIIAIWDIQKSNGAMTQKHGMGRALFGLIAGLVGTFFFVMFLVVWLSDGPPE